MGGGANAGKWHSAQLGSGGLHSSWTHWENSSQSRELSQTTSRTRPQRERTDVNGHAWLGTKMHFFKTFFNASNWDLDLDLELVWVSSLIPFTFIPFIVCEIFLFLPFYFRIRCGMFGCGEGIIHARPIVFVVLWFGFGELFADGSAGDGLEWVKEPLNPHFFWKKYDIK